MTHIGEVVKVDLGKRGYPIVIGTDLISRTDTYAKFIGSSQVMIVTNETVARLYLKKVEAALGNYDVKTVVLADGERYKTLETVTTILDRLLEHRFNRDCTLLALGGGVVGDMSGFAAACYQRGVDLIQVPTTLLSQVDSSVGGKTGVNHRLGKNMIGAFHQPAGVVIDVDTLATLSAREYSAGIAEVIKYALINDGAFFDWLSGNIEKIMAREYAALLFCISRSCRNKARLIEADEREDGQRALLNLGHTFGHAIEAASGYGKVLHGEAVAIGLCLAAELSCSMGLLSGSDKDRIYSLVKRAGLPVNAPKDISHRAMMEFMRHDKKIDKGVLRLVLLKEPGVSFICSQFENDLLEEVVTAA